MLGHGLACDHLWIKATCYISSVGLAHEKLYIIELG